MAKIMIYFFIRFKYMININSSYSILEYNRYLCKYISELRYNFSVMEAAIGKT